jgi:DNA polymerase-1
MSKNTLILIDGNAIMHRAYHALPPLSTADGTPTQIIFGFLSMVYKVVLTFHRLILPLPLILQNPPFAINFLKNIKVSDQKLKTILKNKFLW